MGSGVVDQFAKFLKSQDPDLKGYDRSAIYRMVKFYDTYSSKEFMTALPPQFGNEEKVVSFLSLINWTSHLEILTGGKSIEEKIFYILLAHKERLKYGELRIQIEFSV